jgi:hypothetical protein
MKVGVFAVICAAAAVAWILFLVVLVGTAHGARIARPAHRQIYWVCPERPDGTNVTKPYGVCFREFWP